MCVPVLTVLAAGAVGSAVVFGAGMMEQEARAANAQRMAGYQASVAEAQARSAQYEATYARKMARYEAEQMRWDFLRSQGSQRSLLAVNGVDMADGSALDVLLENASEAAKEREMRLHKGEFAAWQSETQGASLLSGAQMSRMREEQSGISGWTYLRQGTSFARSAQWA